MIPKQKILFLLFFVPIILSSQSSVDYKNSREIDSLIKKDQWDIVNFKLNNENLNFIRLSKYSLKYDLLIKLDSASVLYQKGKNTEAKKAVLNSLDLIEKEERKLNRSTYEALKQIAIVKLFYIEKREGNVLQGLKYLTVFSKGMNPIYEKKNRLLFAVAFLELGDYKKGINMLNIRLRDFQLDTKNILYNKTIKQKEKATTYNTKGDAFIKWYKDTGEKKFLDSSLQNYENAYQLMKDAPEFSTYSKALHICRKANIALLQKQYDYALSLFNECEHDPVLMDRNFSREDVWLGKAEVYTFLKKPDSAFLYIGKLHNKKNIYEQRLKIYQLLSINYENRDDNANAYKYAKLLLAEMNKKDIRDNYGNAFLGIYEKQQIKNNFEEVVNNNKKNNFLLIGVIVLIFLGTLIFIIYKKNKRKKEIFLEFQKHLRDISNNNTEPVTEKRNENFSTIENPLVHQILRDLEVLEVQKKFLSNDFKLASTAKDLNTNTAYLSQIINQHKGISFTEYVNDLRINYVLKELHENSTLQKYTIQSISEKIGYKSSTTFIKAFKDRTKTTPSEYIRQLKDNKFSTSLN